MRVTQSMLSQNMLRNLSSSYNNMGKLQEQLNTGKKVTRPSDDPVVVMKGMGYGMQVDKVEQFQKNMGEVNNWLDSSDDALDGVGQVLHRLKELATNASNTGTMTETDRKAIETEIGQLREHLQDMANTKVGDKHIFSGSMTDQPLFNKDKGTFEDGDSFSKNVEIEVFDGISLRVSTDVSKMFKDIDTMLDKVKDLTATGSTATGESFGKLINDIDSHMDVVLSKRADVGARSNRAELMHNRLEMQEGAAKKQRSQNEDVDYEKTITDLITSESIHRATLSVGARIMQPSLMDFLR
ncbi:MULTISPECIES: flagellar hook-associated protein FlgL [unclassified Sporosarcina]|uniref:flagellar hook-associated protein FlgL n=1 Tax=unclassified Sporosarcina TaxID=2647733 RepID=UPI000C16B82D|nr:MULTISPECIES: flagellar hook-associated protein FlgL [unclassified Sporosarcina]PID05005.1 flagellar hook-associated protein FlgL [Sporosarcina sp. P30]PID08005.1 flagellar hook-associated protein FlgL [Sporosarcina sp. P31]PID11759.1 flagellar hook-associated protein FlgL [Sporosarcina sp. P32b]